MSDAEQLGPAGQDRSPGARFHRRLDPMLLVAGGVAVGILVAALHHPQPGMYVVAGALGLGAVLRLVLRPHNAGSLVIRSRHVDVALLALLAVSVGVIAAVTPFPAGRG